MNSNGTYAADYIAARNTSHGQLEFCTMQSGETTYKEAFQATDNPVLSAFRRPPRATLFPYTTLFRSHRRPEQRAAGERRSLVDGEDSPGLTAPAHVRSEEHTSELQSPCKLVCRLLLEKKTKRKERRMKRH